MPYYQGGPVLLTFTLTDANDQAVQAVATSPVCTVTLPDQTTVTPAVTFDSGQTEYKAIGPSAQSGHYLVSWACTDTTYPGGDTDSYDVAPQVEGSIFSLAEGRRALRIAATDDGQDDFIVEFGRAVTDWIEWYCGPVLQQTVVEELTVGGLTVQLSKPPVIDLVAWTSVPAELAADGIAVPTPPSPMFPVMVYGVTYPLTQLHCNSRRAEVRQTSGLPFYYGPYLWRYLAGRPVIPSCISYAARVALKHLFGVERGGAGGSASMAADEETTETPFGFAVPNRAIEMLAPEALGGGSGAIA